MPEWIFAYLLVIAFFVLLVPAILYIEKGPKTEPDTRKAQQNTSRETS